MSDPRDSLLRTLATELDALTALGRRREMATFPGVDFSSNDYLGRAAIEREAVLAGSSGSRLLSGHHHAWDALEAMLAEWHGDAALCFPSGYVANEGLLSTILREADFVASDALNHGSIIDGLRLSKATRAVYRHQDLAHLDELLADAPTEGRRFVVTESIFGMDGDRTDLVALSELCVRHGALLIVDEAHATGCYGATGGGLIEAEGLRDHVFASVHTCGKALGTHGAYVIADAIVREYLVTNCRHLIFTTALPAALARATMQSITWCRSAEGGAARIRLYENIARLARGLGTEAHSHIVPILLGEDARAKTWSETLLAQGLRVPAIRPPTVPEGEARLRISLRSDHRDEDIDRLAAALQDLEAGGG